MSTREGAPVHAAELASVAVKMQLDRAGRPLGSINEPYALGYILGFHDAVGQSHKFEPLAAQWWTMLRVSFIKMAEGDKEVGGVIANRCLDLREDIEFCKGRGFGADEAQDLVKRNMAPSGLANWLRTSAGAA